MRPLGRILQKLMWADQEIRREIQEYGVNVLPINMYSSVPSLAEVDASFEYARPEAPYLCHELFDAQRLERELRSLLVHAAEFEPPADGDEARPETFFWGNSQFSYSDAMAYYCMIRRHRPRTVLEVGSGFSTLVACEAVARNGSGRVVCVEPFPRPFLAGFGVQLVRERAEALPVEFFRGELEDGDVFFIDSTHTVKTGSDCLHLYLRVLPRIGRRLLVHAHDVFLPFGLPQEWLRDRQIFWTEQYLVLALLTDNPRARVIYGSAYHHAYNADLLDRMMDGKWGSGGGSFWFEYAAREELSASG